MRQPRCQQAETSDDHPMMRSCCLLFLRSVGRIPLFPFVRPLQARYNPFLAGMLKGQSRHWCSTSFDPQWSPGPQKTSIRLSCGRAKNCPTLAWHTHACVEFAESRGGKAISKPLGQAVRSKGDKGWAAEFNVPRNGSQAHFDGLSYVCSDAF